MTDVENIFYSPTCYIDGTRRMYWFHLPDLTGFIPVMRVVYQIDMRDIGTVSFKTEKDDKNHNLRLIN